MRRKGKGGKGKAKKPPQPKPKPLRSKAQKKKILETLLPKPKRQAKKAVFIDEGKFASEGDNDVDENERRLPQS